MISAVADTPFEAVVSGADTGLVGTITVEVYDPTTGTSVIAPTTVGITEPRSGTYRALLTVPDPGTLMVRWSYAGTAAEEDLLVTALPVVPSESASTIDPELVRPTVTEVSILERTRTVGMTAGGLGGDTTPSDITVFGTDTRPTATEVEAIIDQAVSAIIGQMPAEVPVVYYGQIRHFVALYSAILIEGSFFRESLDEGSVELYRDLLSTGIPQLRTSIDEEVAEDTFGGFANVTVRSPSMSAMLAMYPDWPVLP